MFHIKRIKSSESGDPDLRNKNNKTRKNKNGRWKLAQVVNNE